MSKQDAARAFGLEAMADDLGMQDWELLMLIRSREGATAQWRRLDRAVSWQMQELRIAGLTVPEIADVWHVSLDRVRVALDGFTGVDDELGLEIWSSEEPLDTVADVEPLDGILLPEDAIDHFGVDAIAAAGGYESHALRALLGGRGRPSPERRRMSEKRNMAIVRLRLAGLGLDEIGREWGMTRERVRQILLQNGGPTSDEVVAARHAAEADRRDRDEKTVVEYLSAHPGADPIRVSQELGWPNSRVTAAIPQRMKHLLRSTKVEQTFSWTDEEVAGILQAAAEIHDLADDAPLTGSMYDVVKEDLDGPSRPTISKMFGSWNEALAAAGLATSTKGRPKSSRYTEQQVWDYVIAYLLDPSVLNPTYAGYDEWHRTHEPAAPSAPYLRLRLGPWSYVRSEAFRRAAEGGLLAAAPSEAADATDSQPEIGDYEYWAADETLNRVRAAGGNPGNPDDYARYQMDGAPTVDRLRSVFGSWGLAMGALGWDPAEYTAQRVRMDDVVVLDQLRDYVREVLDSTGRAPTATEWETDRAKPGTVGPWSYVRRYGSWREALDAAGVPQDQLPVVQGSRPADVNLELLAIALRNAGEQLTMEAWDAGRLPSWPSGATYARRFGGWRAAVDLARSAGSGDAVT